VNQLDNRASNFYIALYWAEFMAAEDPAFKVGLFAGLLACFILLSFFCLLSSADSAAVWWTVIVRCGETCTLLNNNVNID